MDTWPPPTGSRLDAAFYQRPDVIQLAQELLGTVLITHFPEGYCSGRIVETEAYRGPTDRASHAYNERRTARTAPMYAAGGIAYVYLIYGLHHLFNVVTGPAGLPHAVLIRAIEPLDNPELMLQRRGQAVLRPALSAGPGTASAALGITTAYTGYSLLDPAGPIWLEDRQLQPSAAQIIASTRVGVAYAGPDAFLPWRFRIKDSPWTSRGKGIDGQ